MAPHGPDNLRGSLGRAGNARCREPAGNKGGKLVFRQEADFVINRTLEKWPLPIVEDGHKHPAATADEKIGCLVVLDVASHHPFDSQGLAQLDDLLELVKGD